MHGGNPKGWTVTVENQGSRCGEHLQPEVTRCWGGSIEDEQLQVDSRARATEGECPLARSVLHSTELDYMGSRSVPHEGKRISSRYSDAAPSAKFALSG
ncbi:hypothetical protein D9M68_906050 [compost metagenome]